MAATDTDIAIAQVDAPRRRDDVLPEHEAQWPATEFVGKLVRAQYDGTASTSKEIGNLVRGPGGNYPSWRIEQIARELGLAEEKRDAIIERVRAEDAAKTSERQRTPQPLKPRIASIDDAIAVVSNGDATPTRRMLREDLQAIASGPKCKECGQPFQPWRHWQGRLVATGKCHACFSAKLKRTDAKSAPEAEPEPEPEPIRTPAPPAPTLAAVLDCPLDGDEDDDVIEDEAELTFADLPGHGAVFELLDLLPVSGRWSGKRRYRWLTAFTATLDLLIDDDRDEEAE